MTDDITLGEFGAMPVARLNGVGEKRTKAFEQLGVVTLLDLIQHYPRRYIDRTNEATIRDLAVGEEGMVLARVERVQTRRMGGKRSMVNVVVRDSSGSLTCTFFNQPWREKQLSAGTEAVF